MKAPATARSVAITVLHRVADRGAYASAALDAELKRARLSATDAALATEIVYGTLRALPALDARIAAQLKQGCKLDGLARAALRAGCYQLMHLSRVPAHAVVDESVRVVRGARSPRLGGFVNAVLRGLARQRPEHPAPPEHVLVEPWVRASLEAGLGPERTAALLDQRPSSPPIGLRVSAGRDIDAIATAIAAARPDAELARGLAPRALRVRRAGDPRGLPGYAEGDLSVQEEGSQLLALALGAEPGETVADLCAGHGGKTTLLAERVGPRGSITAVDVDERKLERIAPELARLGRSDVRVPTAAVDLGVGIGELAPASFDRVLVDAPCAGLGTLHRRPEILLRLTPDDLPRLGELQLRILEHAASLVRPGGVLAYSVCSPTRDEGALVAERFERLHGAFTRSPDGPAARTKIPADRDGILRLGPWLGDGAWGAPDAYQLVSWVREG